VLGMEAGYTPGSGSPEGDRSKAWASGLSHYHTWWGEEVSGRRPTGKNLQLLASIRSPLDQRDGRTSRPWVVWDNPTPLVEGTKEGSSSSAGPVGLCI
jgi:hypothetical protein